MQIRQGDIYWIPLAAPEGGETGITHPHMVVQEDVLNASRISTIVVCALTTNLTRAKAPGNVLLDDGEAGLPRRSVVVVSQVSAVDRAQFGAYIGTLSPERVHQILAGMAFVHKLRAHHDG